MSTQTDQAVVLFREIVDSTVAGSPDLVALVRKGFHACGLLGWTESQVWFRQELEGYRTGEELPSYRRDILGETKWTAAGVSDVPGHVAKQLTGESETPEQATTPCWQGIADVIKFAEKGIRGEALERRESQGGYRTFHEERVSFYPPRSFERVIQVVENEVFRFASNSYTTLAFGDALQTIWEGYRATVDPKLRELGLEAHLETISEGLASNNPQQWRNAMWACRDMLHDLAAYLWKDPHKTYDALENDKGTPIEVDESHFVNRLMAYFHAKGARGRSGAYLRSELERIVSSIHALNDLDSKAHSPVTREDAQLASVGTYVLLGEFVRRTDMQPIEDQNTL